MDSRPKPDADPLAAFGATVLQPGLIWACSANADGTRLVEEREPGADCAFRWLHLNLADQRSLHWIERSIPLPPDIHRLFVSQETGQRAIVADGMIGLVIHDFERDFDHMDTGRTGALHVAVGPGLMLTGRYHPLHTLDVVRRRIDAGAPVGDAAAALELLFGAIGDTIEEQVQDVTAGLLAAEDELLSDGMAPDTRALITVRRRCTQLHRTIMSMRSALSRIDGAPGLPAEFAPLVARACQRLQALDGDVVSAQAQLRLLRDELDLQAAQRTNRNLYILSIMTALMMPATLVTGFFGMNTGSLPLAGAGDGTLVAGVLALASSLGTWLALRLMGFVRQ